MKFSRSARKAMAGKLLPSEAMLILLLLVVLVVVPAMLGGLSFKSGRE